MSKVFITALALGLFTGCMTLPGGDTTPASRYALIGPEADCAAAGEPLVLSVPAVNVGLDTARIASRDAGTGEISYLKDVRWAAEVEIMVQQRLASDLECHGYTVLSGHRQKPDQKQLVCEVRALNLVRSGAVDKAEAGLSCMYYRSGTGPGLPIVSHHSSTLDAWSARSAVTATSRAYRAVLADLLAALE